MQTSDRIHQHRIVRNTWSRRRVVGMTATTDWRRTADNAAGDRGMEMEESLKVRVSLTNDYPSLKTTYLSVIVKDVINLNTNN